MEINDDCLLAMYLLRQVPTGISSVARSRRMGGDGLVDNNEALWQFLSTLDATVGFARLTVEILLVLSGFVDHFGDPIGSFIIAARSANGFWKVVEQCPRSSRNLTEKAFLSTTRRCNYCSGHPSCRFYFRN